MRLVSRAAAWCTRSAQHAQRRQLTDELAAAWLGNLKKPGFRGRRDGDPAEAQLASATVQRELDVLQSEGWTLGPQAYSTALGIVSKYGDVKTAEVLLKRMKSEGLVPDRCVYNSMLFAYNNSRGPKADTAERFLAILQEMGEVCDPSDRDAATFLAVIHGLSKRGTYPEVAQAVNLFREQGVTITLPMYNVLVSSAPDFAEAERIVERMRDEGFVPDRITLGSMFKACAREANTDGARELMHTYRHSVDLTVKEWTGYLTVWKAANDFEGAKEVWDTMVAKGISPSTITYGTMMRLCVTHLRETGDASYERAAAAYFEEALEKREAKSPLLVTILMEAYSMRRSAEGARRLRGVSQALGLPLAGICKKFYTIATGEAIP